MESIVKPVAEFSFKLILTEPEARALDALLGYNEKEFLDMFYKHMGQAYLKPYEKGFMKLVSTERNQLKSQLHTVDAIRSQIKTLVDN